MKKMLLLSLVVSFCFYYSIAQTYTATLAIDEITVDNLKPGDDVVVPVRLIEKSGGLISGISFFIEFDHSLFSWKGSYPEPLNGMKNFHEKIPYTGSSMWVINDNSNQIAAIWLDQTLVGQEVLNNDVFFEIIFTYNGGVLNDKNSKFKWGQEYEEIDGRVVKGVTEMYSEIPDLYVLTLIDGGIKAK